MPPVANPARLQWYSGDGHATGEPPLSRSPFTSSRHKPSLRLQEAWDGAQRVGSPLALPRSCSPERVLGGAPGYRSAGLRERAGPRGRWGRWASPSAGLRAASPPLPCFPPPASILTCKPGCGRPGPASLACTGPTASWPEASIS